MRRISAPALLLAVLFVLASPASADSLGQTQSFRVNTRYDASGASTVSATLRTIGQHGYFYVDDRYWDALLPAQQSTYSTNLNTISALYDSTIYPRTTSFFGTENSPGVDNDPHVVVMMEKLVTGYGGYFETIHSYSKDRTPQSNAREMIFVNVESPSATTGKNYIAHEFQHLISFNQKELLRRAEDDLWLNEARSEYALTVSGFSDPYEGSGLQRRAQAFVRTPSDSLVDWPNTTIDYAIASVFLHYLADRYGQDIVSSTLRTTEAGVAALNEWLSQHGKTERFGDVFADWMLAVYLNDQALDPRYGYARDGLNRVHVAPNITARLNSTNEQSSYDASLKEWQALWIQNTISAVGNSPQVSVRISGSTDVQWRGSVVAKYSDGNSRVIPFSSNAGLANIAVPAQLGESTILSATVAVAQGTDEPVGDRVIIAKPVTVTLSLGTISGSTAPTPPPPPGNPGNFQPVDGDLIRHAGEPEIYVVWGKYRRYLPDGVLALYGFQNRPVLNISDDVFFRYQTSNYVREEGQKKVYALWPDGTKHWMNITATQWDASLRDWGAIFTVNGSEIAWYETGVDITR